MNEYDSREEINLEIRYHRPGAMRVHLVWGIDGWQALPVGKQPPHTALTDEGNMKTAMERQDDLFVARLQIPAGARLDYGFSVAEKNLNQWSYTWEKPTTREATIEIRPRLTLPTIDRAAYGRFIVLGFARSGSSLLANLLSSHPQIKMFSELFNDKLPARKSHSLEAGPLAPDDDPHVYLEQRIFRMYLPHIRAVGFKILYDQARDGDWSAVWDYLRRNRLKIIHLKRRNILDQYLSLELAHKSDIWVASQPEQNVGYNQTIELDPGHCLDFTGRMIKWWRQIDEFFQDSLVLQLTYEDLTANLAAESGRVLDFLGLEFEPLIPNIIKQRTTRKTEMIANYTDLKQAFINGLATGQARAEWLEFFDDEG